MMPPLQIRLYNYIQSSRAKAKELSKQIEINKNKDIKIASLQNNTKVIQEQNITIQTQQNQNNQQQDIINKLSSKVDILHSQKVRLFKEVRKILYPDVENELENDFSDIWD